MGALIFTHGLTPSPRAYTVLHAYLCGDDPHMASAVTARLRGEEGLNDAVIARIAAEATASELRPAALSRIAEALEERIADCMTATGASRDQVESFGTALDKEAAGFERDPQETLRRIVVLTRDAVEASRLVEAQLRHTRQEADSLRSDLQRARRAAEQDHLTGLPNRRSFEGRLDAIVTGRGGADAVVGLIDIDDFKQVNDRFGHAAGDRVLKFVASFLRAQLRRKVMVARFGGEEFALVFPDGTLHDAMKELDGVRERLSQRTLIHQESGEQIGHVTFSAGLALLGGDPAQSLSSADGLLYEAKKAGKNRVSIGS
ncbi:hypothetical protein NS334_01810 [Sphingomonas endophytica]|uniref:diguanylate cyclase n=1 Tax=Sphingomonas endophytica TaxID=869719 RepID=A0A147I9H0_9SPHN|nr:hypothetical protein NS334_01810 [Sphingomonas endophytica]